MMLFHLGEFLIEIGAKGLNFHRNLLLGGEVFDLDKILIEVIFAGDYGEFRVRSDRFLEKRAKFSARERHLDGIAFPTESLSQGEAIVFALIADRHHVDV